MKFVTDLGKGVLGQADPVELWEEITANIPDSVLLKPGVKILSVACGHGTEAVVIAKRMIALGINKEQVNNSIYLIDKYHVFANEVKTKYGFKNVITCDFLEWETDMKFDVIVGNPPYQGDQSGGNKTHSLWKKFIKRSIELSDGYVALVTPSTWLSCAKTKDQFTKTNFFYAKILPNETFNVGVETSFWILNKSDYVSTTLVNDGQHLIVDLQKESIPQCDVSVMALAISRKLSKIVPFKTFSGPIYHSDLSKVKTTEFKYPVYNTTAQSSMFAKKKAADTTTMKIIFSNCGAFRPELDFGVKGTCWHSHSIAVSSVSEGESLLKYLDSNVVKFLNKINRAGGFAGANFVNGIPKIILTKVWTNAELYKHFGLTKKEIDYIEANVK